MWPNGSVASVDDGAVVVLAMLDVCCVMVMVLQ
jgi:hypothetical protein